MRVLTIVVRILLGLVFLVFGSNAFLHFIPMPPMTGHAGDFIGSMNATGNVQVIGLLEVVGGLLLLVGRFVPLGLTLLGPIVVNIVLYHFCMDRSGLAIAAVISALFANLLWRYRDSFSGVLRA